MSVLCVTGCAWTPFGDGEAGIEAGELPEKSSFSCGEVEGDPLFCADFNDGETSGFSFEGGDWEVIDERLIGYGPDAPAGDCTQSLMTHAVLTDVRV